MNKTAHDFARELTTIVDASANALLTLDRVLQLQQQSILALASAGSVPTASLTADRASVPAPTTGTAPRASGSPEAASVAAASPEALLAQAEQSAKVLIAHAPEFAIANLYQVSVHAVGTALLNTVAAQQQLHIIAQAVVTRGAANQLSAPRVPAPRSAEKAASAPASGSSRRQAQNTRAR